MARLGRGDVQRLHCRSSGPQRQRTPGTPAIHAASLVSATAEQGCWLLAELLSSETHNAEEGGDVEGNLDAEPGGLTPVEGLSKQRTNRVHLQTMSLGEACHSPRGGHRTSSRSPGAQQPAHQKCRAWPSGLCTTAGA